MESRGNVNYPAVPGGVNAFTSTFHAGAWSAVNQWPGMTQMRTAPPGKDFSQDFHTYGLRWTPTYMETYLDDPGNVVLRTNFDNPGGFAARDRGVQGPGTHYPWQRVGRNNLAAAPFDQEFYLILNVAVGGTLGFFPDRVAGKPWVDAAGVEGGMGAWNRARKDWLPTWGDPESDQTAMAIKSVHVWQDEALLASGVATASGDWLAASGA
jgi:hypothetical protein